MYKVEVFQEVLRLLYARRYAVNLGFVQRLPIHHPADALMPANFGDPHQHVRPYMAVALTFVYVIPVRHDGLLYQSMPLDPRVCAAARVSSEA